MVETLACLNIIAIGLRIRYVIICKPIIQESMNANIQKLAKGTLKPFLSKRETPFKAVFEHILRNTVSFRRVLRDQQL